MEAGVGSHLRESVLMLSKMNASLGVVCILLSKLVRKSSHYALLEKTEPDLYTPIAPGLHSTSPSAVSSLVKPEIIKISRSKKKWKEGNFSSCMEEFRSLREGHGNWTKLLKRWLKREIGDQHLTCSP